MRKIQQTGSRFLGLILAAALVSSCGSARDREVRAEGSGNLPRNTAEDRATLDLVNDTPIPAGAVLDTQRSLVLGGGSNWTGRLVLKLAIGPVEAFSLYQDEMQSFNWEPLLSIQEESGLLIFTREDRVAMIRVEALGLTGSRVSITAVLRSGRSS